MRTGFANLPLHGGKAPLWLFSRMEKLAREITIAIVAEYGANEMLKRLSDPYWFQAFGCVLGFDWHSSGVTTTVCGALKSGLKGLEKDLGFFVAGGKGGTSRKTPTEIFAWNEKFDFGKDAHVLVNASKLTAKVDSAAIQDGYQLYHHNFFFTLDGSWAVVQQGMNIQKRYARRYHWNSNNIKTNFVDDPKTNICDDHKIKHVLDLTSLESQSTKTAITEIVQNSPEQTIKEYKKVITLNMPRREWVEYSDIKPENLYKVMVATYENQPKNFEQLLGIKGVGPKTIRALTLIAEIAYGTKASWEDPVRFSFSHGGKDGYPFPVDRVTYDQSIHILKNAVNRAKLDHNTKANVLQKLNGNYANTFNL